MSLDAIRGSISSKEIVSVCLSVCVCTYLRFTSALPVLWL